MGHSTLNYNSWKDSERKQFNGASESNEPQQHYPISRIPEPQEDSSITSEMASDIAAGKQKI